MKTNYINQAILFICLMTMIFTSCSEDSFTKIVDVDLVDEDKQLAVVARMNTSEDNQLILVSETLSVLDNFDNFTSLNNANISLTTPDAGILEPTFNTDINLYLLSDYNFKGGQEYKIEIDHPDYAPMKASIVAPSAPEILDVSVQLSERDMSELDEEGFLPGNTDIITIKLKDPPNESNSYFIEGNIGIKDTLNGEVYWGRYFFEISENILEYNDEVISDITFNGKEHELVLLGDRGIGIGNGIPYSAEITITSISEEVLLYENSIDQAYDSNDNPFVEPSTIYTNFDNGFGIFTIDVSQKFEVML